MVENGNGVAPRVGAWIETRNLSYSFTTIMSHPVWVRGLKLAKILLELLGGIVAPRVGAWIETCLSRSRTSTLSKSHPVWVRGLKHRTFSTDRKSTRLNSSHVRTYRMPSSA